VDRQLLANLCRDAVVVGMAGMRTKTDGPYRWDGVMAERREQRH
jgi:hypothetical protein